MRTHRAPIVAIGLFLVSGCAEVELPASGGGAAGGADALPPPSWSRGWGRDGEHVPNSIAFTDEGHVVIGGFWWQETEPFDLGCGDLGETYHDAYDMFVARLDEAGACVWSKSFGSDNDGWDTIHDLAVDRNGDVVFTGALGGSIAFAPDSAGGELDFRGISPAEVVKLEGTNGDHIWSVAFSGGAATVTGNAIATDSAGDVLVTGRLYSSANFGQFELSPNDGNDAFIVKLDGESGQPIWATSLSYAGADEGTAIAVDADDDVVVAGMADDYHLPAADLFVAKLAGTSGETIWDHWWISPGEGDTARIGRIAVTSDQDVIVSASFSGTIHPGVTTLKSAASDGFVAKLDGANGLPRWARAVGGPGDDGVSSVAVGADGVVYAAGATQAADTEGADVLLIAIDPGGNTLWERTFGGAMDQGVASVALGPQGQLALIGTYYGTLELGGQPAIECEATAGLPCDPLVHYPNGFAAVFLP